MTISRAFNPKNIEMKIRRINMDSSWQLQWGKLNLVIDPWLIGSEIDGFSWLNEQWHTTECLSIDKLGTIDAILISQSYSDHCHIPTLKLIDKEVPIFASPKAYKRLLRNFPERHVILLPQLSKETWVSLGELQFAVFCPANRMDPVYYGLIVRKQNEIITYFSHGFQLSNNQKQAISEFDVKVMFATFSTIEIPKLMGGQVNPGLNNVNELVDELKPEFVFNTHDEKKKARGIVMKLASTDYPDLDLVKLDAPSQFVKTIDYSWVNI
jgi:hypothetical protein